MKKIILFAAATLALAACNNGDNYIYEPVAAQISATIGKSAVSRASETSWSLGDKIGVTMGSKYSNMEYTTENGDGSFTGDAMYFNNKTEPVTLTAYYPYTEDISQGISATTSGQYQTPDKQLKLDFLYACEKDVKGSTPSVKFTFSHQMSKLTFIFENGNDGTDVGKITTYTIEGLVMDGTFDTASGVCASKPGAEAEALNIVMAEGTVKNDVALPSLIVFPQSADAVTLKITDNEGQKYSCDLKFADNRIASGNSYQYKVKVNKTKLTVSNPSIAGWTDMGNSETGATSAD